MKVKNIFMLGAVIGLSMSAGAHGAETSLAALSLADLAEVRLTSASRKPESVAETASAVFVLTAEDIRRSGATSIPEALRTVPGVEVVRANDNDWYVSIRGFNEETENKVLVLVDGRTVYSPLFSGVFWYEVDVVMEDIERIEVIRGPGAAMWGANAVNGVINIITKHTRDQQGALVSVTAGTVDRASIATRFGDRVGESGYWAAWAKAFRRDQLDDNRNPIEINTRMTDDWESIAVGFRYDWDPATPETLSIQGSWREIQADESFRHLFLTPPYSEIMTYRRRGNLYHLLGRYAHRPSPESEWSIQAFADGNHSEFGNADLQYETYDLDTQWRFPIGTRHDIVCGAGYRFLTDELVTHPEFGVTFFNPVKREQHLVSMFAEDEIAVIPNRLSLRLGTKVEHNVYTDWEVQPNIRVNGKLSPHHTLWGAVAHAVRTPTRLDSDFFGNAGVVPPAALPAALQSAGLPGRNEILEADPESEELTAYEVGYRYHPGSRFWLDTALFYNDYDKLRTFEILTPGYVPANDPPRYVFRVAPDNGKKGYSYGAEVSSTWRVLDCWALVGSYTYIELDLETRPGSMDVVGLTAVEQNSPRHRFSIHSQWDLTRTIECDLMIRYVDDIEGVNADDYTTFDLRLAWSPNDQFELALVGQNLAEEWHREFRVYEVERSAYAKMTCRF